MNPDKLRQLAGETNGLSELLDTSEVRSADEQAVILLEITAQACRTLDWIMEEGEFAADVARLQDAAQASSNEFWALLTNDERFEDLLRQEARLLRSVGLNDSISQYMLNRIRELRTQIRARQVRLDQVPGLVAEMQKYVCAERDRLRAANRQRQDPPPKVDPSRRRRIGGAIVEGFVGLAIAGGNGAAGTIAFFATLGLSAPLSAATIAGSGVFGGALMGDAVTALRR